MAQMVGRVLPSLEVPGLNPVIVKIYIECLLSTALRKYR